MQPDQVVIGGVGTAVIVVFLVQLVKKLGLPDGYAGYLTAGLSVAFYVVYQLTQVFPQITPTVTGVLTVLAFIATTFVSALVGYKGLRLAEVFKT